MNRAEYLAFAKRNEVPMSLLLEYYNQFNAKKELNFSLESFTDIFSQYLNKFSVTLQHVREYFDKKYEIVTVYDPQGNFITIY